MTEVYEPRDYNQKWVNFAVPFGFTGVLIVVTFVLYCMPMPHAVKRRFRFK